jgi:hypothetical protein
MTGPEWLKPACYGAAGGAAALAILGFNALGWTTAGGAAQAADVHSKAAVVAALTPICVDTARRDVGGAAALDGVKAAPSYQRRDLVIAAGWATMPGAAAADREVATACSAALQAAP